MNTNKPKKAVKYILCAGMFILVMTLFGCISHTENVIKQEEKYEEVVSDAKDTDRDVEENLDEILQDAGSDTELQSVDKDGETVPEEIAEEPVSEEEEPESLEFRKKSYLDEHYEKHGVEMGFESSEDYLAAANAVIDNPDALHKNEAEDGDDIYYLEETNEFVVVSTDGYIRTYFKPRAGIDYYNRQ